MFRRPPRKRRFAFLRHNIMSLFAAAGTCSRRPQGCNIILCRHNYYWAHLLTFSLSRRRFRRNRIIRIRDRWRIAKCKNPRLMRRVGKLSNVSSPADSRSGSRGGRCCLWPLSDEFTSDERPWRMVYGG